MNLNLKKKKSEKLLPESHYKTFFPMCKHMDSFTSYITK